MTLQVQTLAAIERQMDEIKRKNASHVFTNYFKQPLTGSLILGSFSDRTAFFINDDLDFCRLFFRSSDLTDLTQVLKEIVFPRPVVIDYVTREPDSDVQQAFRDAGFSDYAAFVRLITYQIRAFEPSNLCFAEVTDLDRLWDQILTHFDKYTDHYPSKATLLELIKDRQVILNKEHDDIKGYIVFRVQGSKVNFNYFYNKSDDPRDSLRLLHNFYAVLRERGINSGFQWNNVENVRVRKLHRQFGWKEDGMKDLFFIRKDQSSRGCSDE